MHTQFDIDLKLGYDGTIYTRYTDALNAFLVYRDVNGEVIAPKELIIEVYIHTHAFHDSRPITNGQGETVRTVIPTTPLDASY